ncbi:MAG: SH3 domain-containing protein [Flavobacteriaceae bacterium]
MKKITLLLVLFTSLLSAQTVDELFTQANKAYKQAKYNEAIELYQKIEAEGKISSELYFNLGNSYYKLNKVAPTIYNYEKALQLDPLNEDAANNLVFAKRLTLDAIEELPKTFLQKVNENYLQKLSYNQWAIVAIVFSFLASLLFLLFYFAITSSRKRLYFVTSILSFILLILSILLTYNQYNFSKNNIEAIIFAEKSEVKNAPTFNSEDVFTLHEGTKVKVLDAVDNWKKIKLADGKIGWIIASELKVL